MTPKDLVCQEGERQRPRPAAHSSLRAAQDPRSERRRSRARCCAASTAGLAVTGAPAARASHAERLIRQSSDVTPIGRAHSAPSSHCSGDSRSAHSPLAARRNCGPRPAPAQAAQVSPGEPLCSSKGHCCQRAR